MGKVAYASQKTLDGLIAKAKNAAEAQWLRDNVEVSDCLPDPKSPDSYVVVIVNHDAFANTHFKIEERKHDQETDNHS